MKGIDIAWARPDTDGIKATGAQWVARYFSKDPTKNLTKSEIAEYTSADLPIVTVWENTASEATQGRASGAASASLAYNQREAIGLPHDHVIYFAVDTDTTWPQVEEYFDGAAAILTKSCTGVYGSYQIVEAAHAAGYSYLWQTSAWSNGEWSTHANIRQDGGTVLSGGADVDDSFTADFGQFPRPENDMPLNDADKAWITEAIAGGINANRPKAQADNLYWLAHAIAGTLPPGDVPEVDKQSIETIHAAFSGLKPKE